MTALLAQFIFESNTFNEVEAELEIFVDRGTWLIEEADVRAWAARSDSQLAGSMEELAAAGWTVRPIFAAMCGSPAGRLSRRCFERIRQTLRDRLRAFLPADAILLHLHGAACAVGEDDIEGHLLEMVRTELAFAGRLVVSLDLHANVTRRMIANVDAVTAYRTMPHRDFAETGRRAARCLLDSRQTVRTLIKIAALVPPTDTDDTEGRFAEMLGHAREFETRPGILDVSLFPVQPWMDVAEMGTSLVVTALAGSGASHNAWNLALSWYEQRWDWKRGLRSWQDIRQILQSPDPVSEPWILVNTADATTGGSPGSSAQAVLELWPLRHELPGEVLLWVVDPAACEAATAGAAECDLGVQRFPVQGDLLFAGEGRYFARGNAYTGLEFSMGKVAVIKSGRLRIVISSCSALGADPAFYECVGLNPDKALAVEVKSLMGWRSGYKTTPDRGLLFHGPGCTSLEFTRLPYTGERLNLFPLHQTPANPISSWQSP